MKVWMMALSLPGVTVLARQLSARPRLFATAALGVAVGLLMPADLPVASRMVVGFDAFSCAFLVLVLTMMGSADAHRVRLRAQTQDDGATVILVLTIATGAISLLSIIAILSHAKDLATTSFALHVALAAATIVLSWCFVHTNFALHYAHMFYGDSVRGDPGGKQQAASRHLLFPGDAEPDYLDFLYFSMGIGMTCQVADVQITGRSMRRLVLVHSVLAFFFNTAVLALSINIAAGMI